MIEISGEWEQGFEFWSVSRMNLYLKRLLITAPKSKALLQLCETRMDLFIVMRNALCTSQHKLITVLSYIRNEYTKKSKKNLLFIFRKKKLSLLAFDVTMGNNEIIFCPRGLRESWRVTWRFEMFNFRSLITQCLILYRLYNYHETEIFRIRNSMDYIRR